MTINYEVIDRSNAVSKNFVKYGWAKRLNIHIQVYRLLPIK